MVRKNKQLTDKEEAMSRVFNLDFIPAPNRHYAVGQEVFIGNLKNCIVVSDVFGDGKIYKVSHDAIRDEGKNTYNFFKWFQIEETLNTEDHHLIKNSDLVLHFQNRTIDGLFSIAFTFGLDTDAVYQRDYVWSLEDNVALIDSVFNNVDIGKFVFVKNEYEEGSPSYKVLDGKQRMNALVSYYLGEYSYKGLYFSDLSRHEQYHFENYIVFVCILSGLSLEQEVRYFLKLNKSGKVMSSEDLLRAESLLTEHM